MPNPSVLDRLIQARHEELRAIPRRATTAPSGMRVRVGHLLIAAGIAISGERLEQPARPSALPRAA